MNRTMKWVCAVALIAAALPVAAAKKKKEGPWVWPEMPTPVEREAAMALKCESGVVVVARATKVALNSFGSPKPGVVQEEFVRLLVTSEDGVRSSAIPLVMRRGYTLQTVEGRTVSPDGTITAVDRKKDVDQTDVKKFGEDDSEQSVATVRFPAPQVGAVLDLHYIQEFKAEAFWDAPYFYAESLLYNQTSTARVDLEIRISDGNDGKGWNLITMGDVYRNMRLERIPDETSAYAVHLGPYPVEYDEKSAPPSIHTSPTLLAYIDLSDYKVDMDPSKVVNRTMSIDHWGRVQGITFPPEDPTTQWWCLYMAEDRKNNKEFIRLPGEGEKIDVSAIAPASLPLEERLLKLYRCAQESVKYDPDAQRIHSVSDTFKRGVRGTWEGTLLYAYLLDRAGIAYQLGLIADRTALRFSPGVRSTYIYDFFTALVVERAGQPPLVLVPGDFSLDFGLLPFDYQNALVLRPDGEKSLKVFYSPVNPPAKDAVTWRYAVEMDASGGASGTVTLSKEGASARGFRRWYVRRETRHANPEVLDQEKKSEQERKEELDREVEDAFWTPGNAFTFSGYELVRCEKGAQTPVEFKAQAQGKAVGQANGDRWLVLANPLVAGTSNPFTRPARRNPIWNDAAGRRILEGELVLPAGAKVLELPKGQEVTGPEGIKARYQVGQLERDGRVVITSRFEYDVPLIVPTPLYNAYRLYLDAIARMGQDRCIVQFTAEKELE